MIRSLAPVALTILALIGTSAAAQSVPATAPLGVPSVVQPLTLAAALRQAEDSNPDLAAARNERRAVEGARIQAGAWPNPTVDAQIEDQRRETRQTTVTFSQPFELGGKRSARIEAAERAIEIADIQLGARRAELQAHVTAAFFTALVAQERVTLAQASLDLARRGTDVASKRVVAGKVSPVEETRANVAEGGVRVELIQAQGELRASLDLLRGAIGPGAAIASLDGQTLAMPRLPTVGEVSGRIESAPAVREARLDVQRFGALAELERAKRIPDVTFTVGGTRPNELGRTQAVVGLSIPLPIFDTNRGNLLEALRRQDKAEDLAQAAELRTRAEALAARNRFAAALAEVDVLRTQVLPGAQSAFEAATKGFELGKFSYLEALDAQRTLLQSRAQYLRALGETHRSATDLQRLLGAAATDLTSTSSPFQERP